MLNLFRLSRQSIQIYISYNYRIKLMPSNWSKIRDEWLDRTAVAKDDAKWALEALINSEEELFEIEQKIKNKEDAISQVKFLKKRLKKLFP